MSFLSRRKFLQVSAVAGSSAALGILADAAVIEPDFPRLTKLEIPLARLPAAWDGLRIAQLSDFHYNKWFSAVAIRRAVSMVNNLKVDLVLLTGDFVTIPVNPTRLKAKRAARDIEPCVEILRTLQASLGIFACLGNHDVGSDPARVSRTLKANGIAVLINRAVPVEQSGSRIWISGLGDALEGKDDLDAALQDIPGGEPVVLLAHEPDLALRVAKYPVDLQLSGHSHGGQVRFPWIGAPVLPELAEIYPWGLHQIGNLMLYTNVGIGTIRLPVRFNCPPEVTLITLRSNPSIRK